MAIPIHAHEAMLLDHIVILVDNLDLASQDYTDLGFSVVVGGEHADGVTQNALVAFKDGSYLELLNFLAPPPDDHLFARGGRSAEGIIAYALLPDDISADINRARQHGLRIEGPLEGGRTRPDGLELLWQIGRTSEPVLPFLCADVTPRDLRVPHGPAQHHPNGVTGIADVRVLVGDLAVGAKLYRALLGDAAQTEETADTVRFKLGPTIITLTEPQTDAERARLAQHGPGAYALTLRSPHEGVEQHDAKTHGVEVRLECGE